jgi:hypothetical protein
MVGSSLPLGRWTVVDCKKLEVVSAHGSQCDAEAERDRLNQADGDTSYNVLLALRPVAHGMGCAGG